MQRAKKAPVNCSRCSGIHSESAVTLEDTSRANKFLAEMAETVEPGKMRQPEQYHASRVCTDEMHPWNEEMLIVDIPPMWRDVLHYPSDLPTKVSVSPHTLMTECTATMKRKIGGSLFRNPKYWIKVMPGTAVATVMEQGGVSCRITDKRHPNRDFKQRLRSQTNEDRKIMWEKMEDMEKKGLVEDVPKVDKLEYQGRVEVPEYVSPSFCQAKPGKENSPVPEAYRCLTDMKNSGSNKCAVCNKFKQEGMVEVHGQIKPGDLMLSFDLKDAYGQSLVIPKLRKMLRTILSKPDSNGNHSKFVKKQYRTLSQGWAPSPERFTKLLREPLRVLRGLGMRIVHKIDDLLLIVSTLYEARLHGYILVWFLAELGAIFSAQKGLYDGRRRVLWHGFTICSVMMMTSMPSVKVTKIVMLAKQTAAMLRNPNATFTLRWIAGVIGVLMAGIDGISAVRLHTLDLSTWRLWCMKKDSSKSGWDVKYEVASLGLELRKALLVEMEYWMAGYRPEDPAWIHWNGRTHQVGEAVVTLYTDACNYQWGVYIAADKSRGYPEVSYKRPFHGDQLGWHITLQETYGAAQGVLEVVKERDLWDCIVLAMVDATTAVKYVRCLGGKKQAHAKAVMAMEEECIRRRVEVRCFHVPGEMNPADAPSRDLVGVNELSLHESIFDELSRRWGPFEVDCFAAQWNNQTPCYYTWERGDPNAAAVDAFTMSWKGGTQWMFPPLHKQIQARIMQRLVADQVVMAVLVIPLWKTETLAQALTMLVDAPMVIPVDDWVLKLPQAYTSNLEAQSLAAKVQWSTLVPTKCLIAMNLSSSVNLRGEYLQRLQRISGEYTSRTEMATTVAGILRRSGGTLFGGSGRQKEGLLVLSEMLISQMRWPHTRSRSPGTKVR